MPSTRHARVVRRVAKRYRGFQTRVLSGVQRRPASVVIEPYDESVGSSVWHGGLAIPLRDKTTVHAARRTIAAMAFHP